MTSAWFEFPTEKILVFLIDQDSEIVWFDGSKSELLMKKGSGLNLII